MVLDWMLLQKGFVTNGQDEIQQTQKDNLIQNLGFSVIQRKTQKDQ